MFNINFCRKLDSNRGPLESETTALPTEPQPLKSLLTTEVALTMAPMLSSICMGVDPEEEMGAKGQHSINGPLLPNYRCVVKLVLSFHLIPIVGHTCWPILLTLSCSFHLLPYPHCIMCVYDALYVDSLLKTGVSVNKHELIQQVVSP